ncbi:MAG: hypothetical protein JXA93_23420 [Anaerolineae bacterium]|nr:hypothetical protein [Anaerolineae bacterium]
MDRKRTLALLVTMAILLLGASQVTGQQDGMESPQGTYGPAFTYQGQLKGPGGPVNGTCDLRFRLFNAAAAGTQVGSTVTHEGVELVDGLFTARLDFGGVHDGSARWLEVAVRCPAGSGEYIPLTPLQELTAAPAALALALPFHAEANIDGPLVSIHQKNSSSLAAALFISSYGGPSLWVEGGLDGLYVASAGRDGVSVNAAPRHGLAVNWAGWDGVYVGSAGFPSATTPSDHNNGVEVAGAEWYGLYVGNAGFDGLHIGSVGENGVRVESTGLSGFFVDWADSNGFHVSGAGANGLSVGSTGADGVHVGVAGSPSSLTLSDLNNGFEVGGAQGHGLYVGRADNTGVYVQSAGWNGLVVDEAGGDGVRATNTVYNALYGDTANAQGEWGLYTPDKAHAQNVTLQTLSLIAQVSGPHSLEPGDLVAADGVGATLQGATTPLPLVRLAGSGASGVIGVVEGRLALTPVPQMGDEGAGERLELRSAAGPARPGDYVRLTVLGVARIKVDAGQGSIQPGTRLTAGAGGRARALKTVVVDGLTLAESAPTVGVALTAPDEDGLAWVLVNPQ